VAALPERFRRTPSRRCNGRVEAKLGHLTHRRRKEQSAYTTITLIDLLALIKVELPDVISGGAGR